MYASHFITNFPHSSLYQQLEYYQEEIIKEKKLLHNFIAPPNI